MNILLEYGLANSLTLNIIWLLLLLSLKYYKDVIIKRQRERINMLEEVWTRKKHELQ